jgi:hypothetical protein
MRAQHIERFSRPWTRDRSSVGSERVILAQHWAAAAVMPFLHILEVLGGERLGPLWEAPLPRLHVRRGPRRLSLLEKPPFRI